MALISSRMPSVRRVIEPDLLFHPDRQEDRSPHPLKGLIDFGPFSRSLVNNVLDPIRIGVIVPNGWLFRFDELINELESSPSPIERKNYLVQFPGFSRVFGVRVVSASDSARIELSESVQSEVESSKNPHLALTQHLRRAIDRLSANRTEFDVVFVFLPVAWKECFYGNDEDEDFDLHDYIKGVMAIRDIPSQVIREDQALTYKCRCSVMWRLSIATYCKAGGVPWKLADAEPDTAFIGLSYAVRSSSNGPRFITCCSQVFDADGAGLEFILYEPQEFRTERDDPYLSRAEMRRVMARSLGLYQRRHSGRSPKRIIVHKSTRFTSHEVDGCFDALASCESVDLIQVIQSSSWRGVKLIGNNKPDNYPIDRCSYIGIGKREVLLWTQGNSQSVTGGRNFYKEGKGIPAPLLLTRYAGHGSWDYSCSTLLGLTKMNWNNDGLYDRLPVTLGFASTLAKTIKHMPEISNRPYQLRFFI